MPSKQSAAVRGRWEASRLAMVQPGFDAPDDESWGDLTAEPRGVDYLETEAAGLPATWRRRPGRGRCSSATACSPKACSPRLRVT